MKYNVKALAPLFIAVMLSIQIRPESALGHYGALYEPPDGKTYHGLGWGTSQQIIYDGLFTSDKHPLILQSMSDIPGTRGMTVGRLLTALTGPILHPDSQYIELGVHFKDTSHALDSVFAYTDDLDNYIDTMAIAFNLYDRPFFLRIGYECNGPWNGYSPWTYAIAFRKLVLELRARGVDNFATVWCYEPDATEDFADSTGQGWKWYPGDDVVDWFGLDVFYAEHFDPDLPDSLGGRLTKKGRSEMFLRFADERGKPVMLNETSACHVYITPDSLDPGWPDGIHDWEFWFEPFFEFISNHPAIKSVEYINLNWTLYELYHEWGDGRIEINTYIRDRWIPAVSQERFLHAGYDIASTSGVSESSALPEVFNLRCHPNPFNGKALISFDLKSSGHVSIKVYNVAGQLVETLTDGEFGAGRHSLAWDASGYSTGVYFYRLALGDKAAAGKMLLLK